MHSWTFLSATGRNDLPIVVGVCTTCGEMRRAVATSGDHIDLTGECPREPQVDDDTPPPPAVW